MAPRVLVLSNGAAGARKQAEALAQAMGFGGRYSLDTVRDSRVLGWLPPQLREYTDALVPAAWRTNVVREPFPDLLIASGRTTISAAAAVRQASGGRTFVVQVQHPYVSPSLFSAVVCPEHDYPPEGAGGPRPEPNVLLTLGSLCNVTPESLRASAERWRGQPHFGAFERPLTAVLVGGHTRHFPFGAAFARALAARLAAIPSGSLLVTLSRRTPPGARAELLAVLRPLVESGRAWVYDPSAPEGSRWSPPSLERGGEHSNPYDGLLALADRVVVTADSVNMATEAAASGRRLYVAGAEECREYSKLNRFHAALAQRRLARPLSALLEEGEADDGGVWGPPLAETARVGQELARRFHEHLVRWGGAGPGHGGQA
eukprot:tig00000404_g385.t1